MSTSPRRAHALGEPAPLQRLDLQPFPYDTVVASQETLEPQTAAFDAGRDNRKTADVSSREAQAKAQGKQEARAEAHKAYEEQLAKERSCLATALAQFTRDRATYFQKVEGEVVQLALSIARKILHREAQLDPLLLAGIVRVALEKIDRATGVVLHVHPQNSADWRRFLATQLEPADLPEIVDDPSQPLDSCQLETAMGTAAFGLDIQLKEIEQGLMDVLAARPGSGS
jgi:flagellar assembly protein FliH